MPQLEQFMTDDFLRYAAECRRMASFACAHETEALPAAKSSARWTDWADRLKSLYPQPQEAYPGTVAAAAWAA